MAERPAVVRTVALAVLTATIAIVLSFHRLGANSIFGDEAIYANIARKAAVEGHWYPLQSETGRYVHKPPLAIWPMALRFELAGESELNARAGSAVAAVLLTTSRPWLLEHGVREAVGDIWTTLFTGAALLLYVRARVTESRRLMIAAGISAAAGSLIKGPVVFLILVGVGVLWEGAAKLLLGRRPAFRALFLVVLASAIPFALWVGDNAANDAVVRAELWSQFAGRLTQVIDSTHAQGAGFYPRVIAQAFGVWLVALCFPMLWKWLRTSATAILLPLWTLFPIVAFRFRSRSCRGTSIPPCRRSRC